MTNNYLPLFIELRQRFSPYSVLLIYDNNLNRLNPKLFFLLLHFFVIVSNHFFAFPDGLNLPIKNLTIEQKRCIANMLNDKDSYGKQFILEIN